MFYDSMYYDAFKYFSSYLFRNLSWFVLGVSCLELYFDIPNNKIIIDQEVVKNMKIIQYNENGELKDSYYTPDYNVKVVPRKNNQSGFYKKVKRKSIGHIYDKNAKYIKDNNISHIDINSNPNGMRLEFKLFRSNCIYLSLLNLNGNYNDILSKYLELLATIYNRYFSDNIKIIGKHNKELTKVIRKANVVGTRYKGNKLAKSEKITKDKILEKRNENDRLKYMILEQKMKIGEIPENIVDYIKDNKETIDIAIDAWGE
jgi:hypothetical protein